MTPRIKRLHHLNHKQVTMKGIPNRRPDFMQKADAILYGQIWEAQARRAQQAIKPYRGSKLETQLRKLPREP